MLLFLHLLISILIFFIGFLVLFHDSKSYTNRFFFGYSATTFLWLIFNQITLSVRPQNALPWVREVLAFGGLSIFFFYFFALNFPRQELAFKKSGFYQLLGWAGLLFVLAQTPLVFSRVDIANGLPVPIPAMLIPFFSGSLILVVIITFVLLVRRYIRSQGLERRQWQFVSGGLAMSYVLVISLLFLRVILFGKSSAAVYSPLFMIPSIFGSAYAIFRLGLLRTKVVATEIFALILLFASVWQILFAQTAAAIGLQIVIVLLVLVFCVLLIRSVLAEVRQREQLELLSKQLEQANEQLTAIDQAKTEFLSVASHQLRTPLTAIKGYVSMLLEGDFGQVTAEQRETLNTVFESSQRLVSLISDLLDLSRIESGRMEFDFTAVDLCNVIDSIMAELAPKAKAKGLYLYFDQVNRACPEIKADEEKIRQALINLIDNGIKYTVHGGVTIRLQVVGKQLRFSVADTGIGVDPKEKTRLFEKFFRSDSAIATTREGTGLGIYVVKKIVESHHGTIWFDSPGIGQGTTFYVELPIPDGKIVEERIKISSLEAF